MDAAHALDYFFRDPPELDEKAKTKFLTPASAPHLDALARACSVAPSTGTPEALEAILRSYVEEHELKMKEVAQPARVALTGRTASPPLFDVMVVIGRERSLSRLESAARIAQDG